MMTKTIPPPQEIVNKYEFATGTWESGSESTNKWSTTDTPGNGTFYYAVTSIEHSGLESKSLSNIYSITVSGGSGTGSQDTAYPSNPGDDGDFYTSYNVNNAKKLIRYYNIYAEDGSNPSIDQTNRVASVSNNACSGSKCSWIDCIGYTGGTTQFVVTAVDTQGNESTALSVTVTHKKSPAVVDGQYTIEWEGVSGIRTISISGSQTVTTGGSQTLIFQQ